MWLMLLVSVSGCGVSEKTYPKVKQTFLAMGGIPVEIIAEGVQAPAVTMAVDTAESNVERWENQLSFYRENSMLNQIRRSPGKSFRVPDELWETLVKAREANRISRGTFDITVGPLIHLWKDAEKTQTFPDPAAITSIKDKIGFNHVLMDDLERRVIVEAPNPEADMSIDIGGIAKGLFAEWISRDTLTLWQENGIKGARKLIINVGGDMFCRSLAPDAECRIGIRDPFNPQGLWGTLTVKDGAVVTSGTYERFFDIAGRRYCHIVDPRTGYPIETDLVSVTISDPSGALADALATAVFVLGESDGWEMIAARPETGMVLIRKDGSYRVTPNLESSLEIIPPTQPPGKTR